MLFIFDDAFDLVIGDRAGVAGVMAVEGEGVAVIAVEAVAGAEPHEAVAVAEDTVGAAL